MSSLFLSSRSKVFGKSTTSLKMEDEDDFSFDRDQLRFEELCLEVAPRLSDVCAYWFKDHQNLQFSEALRELVSNKETRKVFANFAKTHPECKLLDVDFWIGSGGNQRGQAMKKGKETIERIKAMASEEPELANHLHLKLQHHKPSRSEYDLLQHAVINFLQLKVYPAFLESSFLNKLKSVSREQFDLQRYALNHIPHINTAMDWFHLVLEIMHSECLDGILMAIVDLTLPDDPVVGVSPSWEQHLEFDLEWIIGRNMRFLKGPNAKIERDELIESLLSDKNSNLKVATSVLYKATGKSFDALQLCKIVTINEIPRFGFYCICNQDQNQDALHMDALFEIMSIIPCDVTVSEDITLGGGSEEYRLSNCEGHEPLKRVSVLTAAENAIDETYLKTKKWETRYTTVAPLTMEVYKLFSPLDTYFEERWDGFSELLESEAAMRIFKNFIENKSRGSGYWLGKTNVDEDMVDGEYLRKVSEAFEFPEQPASHILKRCHKHKRQAEHHDHFQLARISVLHLMAFQIYEEFVSSSHFEKLKPKHEGVFQRHKELVSKLTPITSRDQWRLALFEALGKLFPGIAAVICDPYELECPIVDVHGTNFFQVTGYNKHIILGRNCRFLQGPKTGSNFRELIRTALTSDKEISLGCINYRKDGNTFQNLLHIHPVFSSEDDHKQVEYFLSAQLDTTEGRSELEMHHFHTIVGLLPRVAKYTSACSSEIPNNSTSLNTHMISEMLTPAEKIANLVTQQKQLKRSHWEEHIFQVSEQTVDTTPYHAGTVHLIPHREGLKELLSEFELSACFSDYLIEVLPGAQFWLFYENVEQYDYNTTKEWLVNENPFVLYEAQSCMCDNAHHARESNDRRSTRRLLGLGSKKRGKIAKKKTKKTKVSSFKQSKKQNREGAYEQFLNKLRQRPDPLTLVEEKSMRNNKRSELRDFKRLRGNIIEMLAFEIYFHFLHSHNVKELLERPQYQPQLMRRNSLELPNTAMDWLHKFGEAAEHFHLAITVSDPTLKDCPLVFVNRQFEIETGYTKALALGRNCRFLQGPETNPVARVRMRRDLLQGRETYIRIVNYRRDGTRFWNLLSLIHVRLPSEPSARFIIGLQYNTTKPLRFMEIECLRCILAMLPRTMLLKNKSHNVSTYHSGTEHLVNSSPKNRRYSAVQRREAGGNRRQSSLRGAKINSRRGVGSPRRASICRSNSPEKSKRVSFVTLSESQRADLERESELKGDAEERDCDSTPDCDEDNDDGCEGTADSQDSVLRATEASHDYSKANCQNCGESMLMEEVELHQFSCSVFDGKANQQCIEEASFNNHNLDCNTEDVEFIDSWNLKDFNPFADGDRSFGY